MFVCGFVGWFVCACVCNHTNIITPALTTQQPPPPPPLSSGSSSSKEQQLEEEGLPRLVSVMWKLAAWDITVRSVSVCLVLCAM